MPGEACKPYTYVMTITYGAVVLGNVLKVSGSGKLFPYNYSTAVQQRLANAHYAGRGVIQRQGCVKPISVLETHLIRISTGDKNVSKKTPTKSNHHGFY